jgi:phosphatidate cytidylyltransferase
VLRVLSALVLLPVVLGIVFLAPGWATVVLALAVLVAATLEYARIAEGRESRLPRTLMIVAAGSAALAAALPGVPLEGPLMAATVVVSVAALGAGPGGDVVRRVAAALFPVLYLGLPLGVMAGVRMTWGAPALLALLATTIVSDTAQYYGGRALGRRPLAPRVSPKKTVEGAVAGLAAGGLVLPAFGWWWLPGVAPAVLWGLGLGLVALGIAGDLFESLLKRSAGVKDASAIIPGHGGMLDRIDSLLFAAPFYYVCLRYTM